jgi:hypothetical protein
VLADDSNERTAVPVAGVKTTTGAIEQIRIESRFDTMAEAYFVIRDRHGMSEYEARSFRSSIASALPSMHHKMGPLAIADLIGLDTVPVTLEVLSAELEESKYTPAPLAADERQCISPELIAAVRRWASSDGMFLTATAARNALWPIAAACTRRSGEHLFSPSGTDHTSSHWRSDRTLGNGQAKGRGTAGDDCFDLRQAANEIALLPPPVVPFLCGRLRTTSSTACEHPVAHDRL